MLISEQRMSSNVICNGYDKASFLSFFTYYCAYYFILFYFFFGFLLYFLKTFNQGLIIVRNEWTRSGVNHWSKKDFSKGWCSNLN